MNTETFYSRFSQYDLVRKQLFCKLINPHRHPDKWEDTPFRRWMDLRLCCYYDMAEDGLPDTAVTIRNSTLSIWNTGAERVLADAWHNTADRQRVLFCPLGRVLNELEENLSGTRPLSLLEDSPLYILSNTARIFGAVYMAVPDIRRQIGKLLKENYYILPSSIHECLILPDTGMIGAEELNSLVRLVNRDHVAEDEILADHVYYYECAQDAVRLC